MRTCTPAILRVCFLVLALPMAGFATTLTLEDPGLTYYQQTENRPCVIGDPSCQGPAGFDFGIIPANAADYSVYSDADSQVAGDQTYTVGTIRDLKGDSLFIGIDLNTTGQDPLEALLQFVVYIDGNLEFEYTGTASLTDTNNGTGYSDSLLKGLNLAGFSDSSTIQFFANVTNGSDGREQFFLIGANEAPDGCLVTPCPLPPAQDVPVPEPATLVMLGAGLVVLSMGARHKYRRR